MKSVTSANANRHFSAMLREVSQGEEIVVVSRGKPVARIVGVQSADVSRRAAHAALVARLRTRKPAGKRDWTRDDLYE